MRVVGTKDAPPTLKSESGTVDDSLTRRGVPRNCNGLIGYKEKARPTINGSKLEEGLQSEPSGIVNKTSQIL